MDYNSLKDTIYRITQKQKFSSSDADTKVNKIILGSILFTTCKRLIKLNSSFLGSIEETAEQYASAFLPIVEEMKTKYSTYREIKNFIEKKKINSFLSISTLDAEKIYNLYENKQLKDSIDLLLNIHMYYLNLYNWNNQGNHQGEYHLNIHHYLP